MLSCSPNPYGIPIQNTKKYQGCYSINGHIFEINQNSIKDTGTNQSIAVENFLYQKTYAVISTVRNLEVLKNNGDVVFGSQRTGFFYRFDDREAPTALLVAKHGGGYLRMEKGECSEKVDSRIVNGLNSYTAAGPGRSATQTAGGNPTSD